MLVIPLQTFLADYGMVWMGDKSNPESDHYIDDKFSTDEEAEVWKPGKSFENNQNIPQNCFNEFLLL